MNKLKYLFCLISSYAFIFGFCEYFHGDGTLGNQSLWNLFLFAGAFFLVERGFAVGEKRLKVHSVIFAGVLSLALVVGHTLYMDNSIQSLFTLGGLAKAGITLVGFTVVLTAIILLALSRLEKISECKGCMHWKIFRRPMLLAVVIFVAWIPCYLAYYPGIFSYDITIQTRQALGIEEMTRFHPPLHTFFWKWCLELEEGIGVNALLFYSIVQMVLMAVAFAYVLRFLKKRGCGNGMLLGALLYFALNPVIAIFSFVPTKDAALTVFLTLYIVELCDAILRDGEITKNIWQYLRVILFGVLSCLMRNNVVYAIVFAGLLMLIIYRKLWKQVLIWSVSIVLGYSLINGPLFTLLGVGEGSSGEMLSVPLQQLACVVYYHGEELTAEDKAAIDEFLPAEELAGRYNFRLADPVKDVFDSKEFDAEPLKFVKLWWKFLLRYPGEYADAFLNLNLPYWYPDANSVDSHAGRDYIESFVTDIPDFEYPVVRDSKLPWLLEKYEKVASYDAFKTKPVIANLFSISTPIWLLLAGVCVLSWKRRKDLIVSFLPAIGLWLTFMLGPVSNFRYMFPIIALYPFYVALALQLGRKNNTGELQE